MVHLQRVLPILFVKQPAYFLYFFLLKEGLVLELNFWDQNGFLGLYTTKKIQASVDRNVNIFLSVAHA